MPAPTAQRPGRSARRRGTVGVAVVMLALLSMLVVGVPVAGAGVGTQNLTVLLSGTGTGTVTSSPAGIDCGSTCTFDFPANSPVSLTASPDPSSTFDSWSGACSGSGSCDLPMDMDYSVTAVFTLKTQTLVVTDSGTGSGTVTSSPAGINCGGNCSQDYDYGTDVTLSPNPDAGSTFDHWTGDCSGSGSCDTVMSQDRAVTAVFTLIPPVTHTLDVTDSGTGTGTVTSSPAGINCGGNCTQDYNQGTDVTLSQNADAGSSFTHWTGDCSGSGSCDVIMSQDRAVTAVFTLIPPTMHTLDVTDSGTGTGTVTSSPAGINCGSNCTQDYNQGTDVTLTPAPDPSSTFDHWTGDCSGSGSCDVIMGQDRSVTAVFTLKLRSLDLSKNGTGSGTVTSSPAGISCAPTCSHNYNHGTDVTLTATPAVGSSFTHWSGDCSGSGTCDLPMTQDRTVAATFTLRQFLLTVRKGGNGKGLITSTPVGINCPLICHQMASGFNYGTSVAVHEFPALGSKFMGWAGACTGQGTCVVPITAQRLVVAVFSTVCGRIAFVSTRSGNDDIFTMASDGTAVVNVTKDPADDTDPAWSPDCSRLAFVSDRFGNDDIYVMNADGTGLRRITSGPAIDTQPTWAPGGTRIAFTRTIGTNGNLYVIAPDASHVQELTSGPADDFRPDWSPNGARIAFVSTRNGGQQIFTMSSAGGGVVQVTHSRGQNLQPAWSPNGRRIAFVSTRDGNREIYTSNPDGSGVFRLTHSSGIDAHPSWSPAGLRIVFYTTRTGNDEIFAVYANDTHAIDLSRNPASDTGPVWSR
jgi:Tol biopolymer transport system component